MTSGRAALALTTGLLLATATPVLATPPATPVLATPPATPVRQAPPGASAVATHPGAPQDGSVVSAVLGLRPVLDGLAGDRRVTSLWGWPLVGQPTVVRGFDPPEQRWLAGHRGIDLAGVAGEPVLAVDDGVVAWSGTVAGVGVVSVDHVSGLRSTYQPVTDGAARGDRVARGDRIGRLDSGGHCLAVDCLHLGARRGRRDYVDPAPLLRPVELSLLPLGATPGSS